MDEAVSELSVECDTKDAARALYLLSAPAKEMNMDLVKELGDYLRKITPEAVIRDGDYPRERGVMDVVVIISQLKDLEKVRRYYAKSADIAEKIKRKQEAAARTPGITDEASKDVPSLL